VTGTDNTVDPCKIVLYSGSDSPEVLQVDPGNIVVYTDADRASADFYQKDMAVIVLSSHGKASLGRSADLPRETQQLWTAGFPKGPNIRLDSKSLPSPSIQRVSVERVQKLSGGENVIQVSSSATHGSSGGPVFDSEGNVVGLIQAKESDTSIVYALPLSSVDKMFELKGRPNVALNEWLKPLGDKVDGAAPTEEPSKPAAEKHVPITSSGTSILASEYLTEYDLASFSAVELTILRNEPFARRGYIFRRRELRRVFSTFSWYHQRTSDQVAVERNFSRLERRNVDFISKFQKENGLTW
jgi:YARHG domain/Trypsin-like peptidase domain